MKLSILTFATLVALTTAHSQFRKQADSAFLDKQRKVLKLLVGVGADDKAYEEEKKHVPFPYNKPELYTKSKALERFMESYERGLLNRRGVFTMNNHKNKIDTFNLFDLFYYAKDFDTLFSIASWASHELNPVQWTYAFIPAVFHREDTRGIYIPPMYEVMPHFFTQNEIMHQAVSAKQQGDIYGKFDVNNTGWEWSWHADMLTGPYKSSPKWVGDDIETRMSYFREDVGLANFFAMFHFHFASWLYSNKYEEVHFYRRGEVFYGVYKWLLNRYNLERMSNGMTPVVPFETYEPLPGYNPHIQDNFGRNFMVRQDKLVADKVNKEGSWEIKEIIKRLSDVVDAAAIWEVGPTNQVVSLMSDDINGLDEFGNLLFGSRDAKSRKYYRAPYYNYIGLINDMVKAPNDRDYTTTAIDDGYTRPRDPAFWMVIAAIDRWFDKLLTNFKPYTKEELNFPGVSIEKFDLDRLDTYFERYDWELTNGITFSDRSDRVFKKFEASQFRLNHKPFTYKLTVNSDKEADAIVRVFIGPKSDVDGREFSLDQQRKAMVMLDMFRTKVKSGENVLERHSHESVYFEDYQRYRPFYEKVNKSIETKEPFYYNENWQCFLPHNLMLPRGWKSGKEYAIYAIVTKFDHTVPQDGYYPCHHNLIFDQHSAYYPFDRQILYNEFIQPNMIFSSVKIYHQHDPAKFELAEIKPRGRGWGGL